MDELTTIPSDLKPLLCRAEELGKLSQVSVDGILPNRRINLAMGLAAIHTAQVLEVNKDPFRLHLFILGNEKADWFSEVVILYGGEGEIRMQLYCIVCVIRKRFW